jgi:hypothetical protein
VGEVTRGIPKLASIPGGIYLAGGGWALTKAAEISDAAMAFAAVAGLSGLLFGLSVRALNEPPAGPVSSEVTP